MEGTPRWAGGGRTERPTVRWVTPTYPSVRPGSCRAITRTAQRSPVVGTGHQVRERPQVGQRLAARFPPGPLAADRRREPQLEEGVEVAVAGLEDLPEDAVELVVVHRVQADPADQVDVAHVVERVVHAVEPGVALQQPAVDALVVLVRAPADERLD